VAQLFSLGIMRALTYIIMLLALAFSAMADASSRQSDAEIRQKIVGTWILDVGTTNRTGPYSFSEKGTETYFSNGSFVMKATILDGGKEHQERVEGVWHVEAGMLTDSVTNAVGVPGGAPQNYEHARVIRVDDRELIMKSAGLTIKRKRGNDA
jgi:hypothetical protein